MIKNENVEGEPAYLMQKSVILLQKELLLSINIILIF